MADDALILFQTVAKLNKSRKVVANSNIGLFSLPNAKYRKHQLQKDKKTLLLFFYPSVCLRKAL